MMDVKQKEDAILADGQKAWVIEGKFKPKYYMMMNQGATGATGAGRDVFKSQMAGLRLYIGQDAQYMNKMEFLSSANKTTGTMSFEELKFNQGIPAEAFMYETPEGAVVNDQTETMRKQVAAMKLDGGCE